MASKTAAIRSGRKPPEMQPPHSNKKESPCRCLLVVDGFFMFVLTHSLLPHHHNLLKNLLKTTSQKSSELSNTPQKLESTNFTFFFAAEKLPICENIITHTQIRSF